MRSTPGERVITLSSFTKTVAPGLRIGYAVAPEGLAGAIGKYAENTYISPCMLSQSGFAAYCAAGYFEPGVERAKQELKARCDAMVESVRAHFPAVQMVVPQGGYFLWLDLGPGADTTALVRARRRGRRAVREGCRLLRRRRRHDVPAARVLGGARRSHPRGHRAPRRGHRLSLRLNLRLAQRVGRRRDRGRAAGRPRSACAGARGGLGRAAAGEDERQRDAQQRPERAA